MARSMWTPFSVAAGSLRFDDGEVFGLEGRPDGSELWRRALAAAESAQLKQLIAALPDDESARCHDPGFGLRLDGGATRITVCFECNDAQVGPELTTFAARSPEA